METLTLADFHAYHAADRDIFGRLVNKVRVDIAKSLLIMALWIYLEDLTQSSVTTKMVRLPDNTLEALAKEAILCLNCLESQQPTSSGSMSLIGRIIEKDISLATISQNKYATIYGIKLFLNKVCSWIFTDILSLVLPTSSSINPNIPLTIPGFPNPAFGSVEIFARPLNFVIPCDGIWGWKFTHVVPEFERTMFLTFSRGFEVEEEEVKELFENICGKNVLRIEMEDVVEKRQPLFARMVLRSLSNVDQILAGQFKAKFQINKKHVWARKYEHRQTRK